MFPRVGKKGRDQNKQQNHKLPIPGIMLRADCHHAVGTVCPELSVAPRVVCREWRQKMVVLTVGLGRAVPFCAEKETSVKQFCFPFPLLPHCLY